MAEIDHQSLLADGEVATLAKWLRVGEARFAEQPYSTLKMAVLDSRPDEADRQL